MPIGIVGSDKAFDCVGTVFEAGSPMKSIPTTNMGTRISSIGSALLHCFFHGLELGIDFVDRVERIDFLT